MAIKPSNVVFASDAKYPAAWEACGAFFCFENHFLLFAPLDGHLETLVAIVNCTGDKWPEIPPPSNLTDWDLRSQELMLPANPENHG